MFSAHIISRTSGFMPYVAGPPPTVTVVRKMTIPSASILDDRLSDEEGFQLPAMLRLPQSPGTCTPAGEGSPPKAISRQILAVRNAHSSHRRPPYMYTEAKCDTTNWGADRATLHFRHKVMSYQRHGQGQHRAHGGSISAFARRWNVR